MAWLIRRRHGRAGVETTPAPRHPWLVVQIYVKTLNVWPPRRKPPLPPRDPEAPLCW